MIFILKILLCEDNEKQIEINSEYIKSVVVKKKEQCDIRAFKHPDEIKEEDINWSNTAFLDIDFGRKEKTGIQLAREIIKLNKWVEIVFITAYKEYTAEAYQLQAIGYLEKPIIQFELENMIDKLIRCVNSAHIDNFIELMHNKKSIITRQQDIIYIEKELKKCIISTITNDIDTYENIGSLENKLGNDFIKINQGVLVNRAYICKIENEMVWLSTGKGFKISRGRKKEVVNKLIN